MNTIRFQMAFVIILLCAVGALGTVGVSEWVAYDLTRTAVEREAEGAKQQLLTRVEARNASALVLAELVAGQTSVQERFGAGDRDALAREFVPGFDRLKAEYGIRQFQFHLPPATSYLRVHKPEKHGDDLSSFRKTVVETNARRAPVSGLEKGIAGIGVRGVVPVVSEGRPVGSVEFGLSLHERFVVDFTQDTGFPLAILRETNGGFEVIGSRLPSAIEPEQVRLATQDGGLSWPDSDFYVDQVPVTDFSGNAIAVALIAVDQAPFFAIASTARVAGVGVGAFVLFAALTALFYANRSIFRPLQETTDQLTSLARGETDFDVRGTERRDEIGHIARAVVVCRDNRLDQERLTRDEEVARSQQRSRQEQIEALVGRFQEGAADALEAVDAGNRQLEATAKSLSGIADGSARQARSASSDSGEASGNVQSVAGAAEELAASIAEISHQVQQTTEVVQRATKDSQEMAIADVVPTLKQWVVDAL